MAVILQMSWYPHLHISCRLGLFSCGNMRRDPLMHFIYLFLRIEKNVLC
jgi:hypothetical protein